MDDFRLLVFEHSMDALLITSPSGGILAANPAACSLFGRSEEELRHAGRHGLVDASSPHLENLLSERACTGKARGELVFVRADGTRFPGEVSSALFRETDGTVKTVMVIRDLSRIKAAEQAQAALLFEASRNASELEAILDTQEDVILMYDTGMNVGRANPSFARIYGFDPRGLHVGEIIRRVSCRHLDGRPLVLGEQPTPRALRGEKTVNEPFRVTRGDGSSGIVETSSMPCVVGGAIVGSVTVWHDITELMRAEDTLRASAQEIQDLYEHAPCGYHSLDANGIVVRMNQTELDWLGYGREEVVGRLAYSDLLGPQGKAIFRETFPLFLQSGSLRDLEFDLKRKDGSTLPVLVSATAVRDETGRYVMSRSTVVDLSERQKLEKELQRQARVDVLTGLCNRRHFFELAAQEAARARRYAQPVSLMMIDLDHFKAVNDTYGHDAGDVALRTVGEVCLRSLREVDVLARLGGEEFAALLPETSVGAARDAAERLRRAVEGAALGVGGGVELRVTVSIGVASAEPMPEDVDSLVKRADQALYRAKSSGRNVVCVDGA